jgi:Tlde1 domain
VLLEQGRDFGDVMAFDPVTVDTLLPRRRIGRSEAAALFASVLALSVGAAAWLTEADTTVVSQATANVASFDERFVPLTPSEMFQMRPATALQPLDRSAVAALQAKWRDARDELTQGLVSSDWRRSLGPASTAVAVDSKPAAMSTNEIPLPRSRPATADVQVASADATQSLPPAPEPKQDRSVLQKLSDLLPNKMSLASLTPFQRGPDLAALGYDSQTAVYDISAHAVYLPNGTTLEAHSGIGHLRDDPEHVDQRMVGATPPATYDLKPREALFHGVRALRMTPAEGSTTLGRAGLLVHSYMLGAEGDSNGCVSVRDYDRFRKAYDDGEITRLVVVPSLGSVQTAQRSTSQS